MSEVLGTGLRGSGTRRTVGRWAHAMSLVGMVTALAACDWTMYRFGSERTGFNPNESQIAADSVATLRRAFVAPFGGARGGSNSSPAVANGVAYIGGDDGTLYAFDAAGHTNCSGSPKTCNPLWTAPTNSGAVIDSSPAAVNGVVYAVTGAPDGTLRAYDAAGKTNCTGSPKTCSPLWTAFTGPTSSSPVVAKGIVYLVGSSQVYAFDAAGNTNCSGSPQKTCAPLWTAVPSGGVAADTSLAVANGLLYVVGLSELAAYDASGNTNCSGNPKICTPVWVSNQIDNASTQTTPAIANGVLYVVAKNIATARETLYAYDSAGKTNCAGTVPRTCNPLWTADNVEPIGYASPAVAEGFVYVSGRSAAAGQSTLAAYDAAGNTNCSGSPKTCSPLWTATLSGVGDVQSSPAVANGLVYVGSDGGTLDAFDATGTRNCSGSPTSCTPMWSMSIGEVLSPAVVNGRVYASTGSTLYGFELPNTRLSRDPFLNSTSQHQTEVEPDVLAFGSTIVSAFQAGRFFDGGASDIGWATSTDGGATWSNGFLPGITKFQGGGPYDRVSDPSVAYDARHGVWLIASLPIRESASPPPAPAVVVSRSTDGGHTWGAPVTVGTGAFLDKPWTVCDDSSVSPFSGTCYTEYDEPSAGNRLHMATSTDGGLTWTQAVVPNTSALGGQPLVQPNGTVVVPMDNGSQSLVQAVSSADGGRTYSGPVTIASIVEHVVAGNLRTSALPTAGIDGAGTVYVVWQDCRFRPSCASNDIVMSRSTDGRAWSPVVRVPIDATSSTVDHFIPGLAVDSTTSGVSAHLGLTYYYYPEANCAASTCALDVGFVSSTNGGSNWGSPTQLAGPMSLSWLADTDQGRMVGDYIATSFSGVTAHPVFALASAPTGGVLDEATYTTSRGVSVSGGTVTASGNQPVATVGEQRAVVAPLIRR